MTIATGDGPSDNQRFFLLKINIAFQENISVTIFVNMMITT